MCGSMHGVRRDAVAAGEEQLVSCAAEQSKCCSICTVTLDLYGDLPFTSWGRWQCLRDGADGLNGSYAACGCGTEYWCGALLGGGVWRLAFRRWRGLPLRSPTRRWRASPLAEMVLFHSIEATESLDVDSKLFSKVQVDSERGLGSTVPEQR
jgi:hypothetical protein